MNHSLFPGLAGSFVLLSLSVGGTTGSPPLDRNTEYALDEGSAYEEGCFEPCECPIFYQDGLGGRFSLVPAGADGDFLVFEVAEVEWMVPLQGTDSRIRGSGTYRIGVQRLEQRLELDLEVGDRPVERYDSGLVPVTARFPSIEVAIARNGFYCYDTAFVIRARQIRGGSRLTDPALLLGPVGVLSGGGEGSPVTWGALKRLYSSRP